MDPKSFLVVRKCCSKKCFKSCSESDQKDLFKSFYSKSKIEQDVFLSHCIEQIKIKSMKNRINPKKNHKFCWQYSVCVKGDKIKVCKIMILSIFQISQKRFRIVQRKVASGSSFSENRGTHKNRFNKLDDDVLNLMKVHLNTIPWKNSHYTQQKTELKYFENPELNIKKLYNLFLEYYKEHTKKTLKMSYKTYFYYFKMLKMYSFTSP